jgi:glycosyltransferase involved in cell wall biosynthesis
MIVIACHAWAGEMLGGSFKVASEFAEQLARRGHRVCYVCGTEERAPRNPTVDRGVELWRYPYPHAKSPHPANLLGHVRGTYRMVREVLRTGPAACINGQTPLQFLGASLAARSARLVYTVHSPFADELQEQGAGHSWRGRLAVSLAARIERRNLARATAVHTASQFTLDALAARYGAWVKAKGVVAEAWVDIERFTPAADRAGLRSRLGPEWNTDEPVFFTVRRLEPRMGLENLIDAAQSLALRGHRFRVLIGGAGSLKAELANRAAGTTGTVRMLGRIPDDDLSNCFAAADCFVLPSTGLECFGLTILESYACGVPVIATPVAAIPELVRLAGEEWLAEDTSAAGLAERMESFLAGRLTASRETLRAIAERFGIQSRTQALEAVCVPATRRDTVGRVAPGP